MINRDWLEAFPGRVILAMHAAVDTVPRTHNQLLDIFSQNMFVGSSLLNGRAMVGLFSLSPKP